jgi:hypothetical protein
VGEEAHQARLPAAEHVGRRWMPMRGRLGGGDLSLSGWRGALGHEDHRGGGIRFGQWPEEAAVGGASMAERGIGTRPVALVASSWRLAAQGWHTQWMHGGTRAATPTA